MVTRAASAASYSDETARRLWAQFRESRDPSLRGLLIERYLPLARTAAARLFRSRSDNAVPFADYLQYARLGLVEAIDGFDPAREASFETYSSYRIRGSMLNGLGRESETAAQKSFWRTRVAERVDSLKPPLALSGDDELAELAGMAVGLALGFLLDGDVDKVPDETPQGNPYALAEFAQLRDMVRTTVDLLPQKQQQVIRRHYFEHGEFREIAREMAVTPGRISQLHSQALSRIRDLLKKSSGLDRNI
ncbi:MAG: sigma-70 family RNA polymerase sigma factor [Gammaproteobacteria bacterium]